MENIFITGVSSGIGLDAMRALIGDGYHVIGTVRKASDATQLKDEFGDKCTILTFDVRDINLCMEGLDQIKPKLTSGGLRCLINNAGVAVPGPLQYLTEEEFEHQMDVNVKAVRRITNLLLPFLGVDKKYKPGTIINISSVSGLFNSPFNGAYCISKHALESMTDIYRRELAMFGIKVSAIEPGPVKTKIWAKNKGTLDRFADTEYGSMLKSADKMIENAEKSALDVEVITNTIHKILASKSPKPRYLVHKKKWFFHLIAHYVPDTIVDRIIARTISAKDKFRPI
ncbi:MAG: SDR family NAD(P)-dependent oxidoreductase [Saprospiraceae bacterium]